jgi:hypothetical protein
MRLILMHKNDPQTEAGEKPPIELVHKMGAFVGEYAQAGKFLDGAGLGGSKTRTRLVFRDGRATVKHGPYRGENELPATMLVLKVRTRDEAIGWAERYGKILGDGEIELGKLNEPWDIGLAPEPENPPLQFLLIDKADAATEKDGRTPKQKGDLTRLRAEMAKAGVLTRALDLQPSATSKRLRFRNGDLGTMDGPFAESKELIGGFSVMELSGMEEAVELSRRYAAILGGTLELDLRPLDQFERFEPFKPIA